MRFVMSKAPADPDALPIGLHTKCRSQIALQDAASLIYVKAALPAAT
jgi:hypothetical protein